MDVLFSFFLLSSTFSPILSDWSKKTGNGKRMIDLRLPSSMVRLLIYPLKSFQINLKCHAKSREPL